MTLMVDLNQGWRMAGDLRPALDPAGARRVAALLADLEVLWLEEPLDGSDVKGLAGLRADGSMRIAGGEMVRSFSELLALVEADALDVYQPDAVLVGRDLARQDLRRARVGEGEVVLPHTWTNGIGLLVNFISRPESGAVRFSSTPSTHRRGSPRGGTSCSASARSGHRRRSRRAGAARPGHRPGRGRRRPVPGRLSASGSAERHRAGSQSPSSVAPAVDVVLELLADGVVERRLLVLVECLLIDRGRPGGGVERSLAGPALEVHRGREERAGRSSPGSGSSCARRRGSGRHGRPRDGRRRRARPRRSRAA